MRREDGGIVLRLILWAALILILLSAGLFVYVRMQEPFSFAEATTRTVQTGGDPQAPRVHAGGAIYVATIIRNEGGMPTRIDGLGTVDDRTSLYVATDLSLGDGKTAQPGAASAFEPISIDPGEGVGVLITFHVNPSLDCSGFTKDESGTWPLREVPFEASAYAMPFTEVVRASPAFVQIQVPTRDQCRAALASAGDTVSSPSPA